MRLSSVPDLPWEEIYNGVYCAMNAYSSNIFAHVENEWSRESMCVKYFSNAHHTVFHWESETLRHPKRNPEFVRPGFLCADQQAQGSFRNSVSDLLEPQPSPVEPASVRHSACCRM